MPVPGPFKKSGQTKQQTMENKAQLALEISRYATDDVREGESMAVDLMPLSFESLKQIRDDLLDYDHLHGRITPRWT